MFCPWKTRTIRAGVVGCFVALHIGIELTMHVVIFSEASLAALTLFTPGTFWSRAWVQRIARWLPGQTVEAAIYRVADPVSGGPTDRNGSSER